MRGKITKQQLLLAIIIAIILIIAVLLIVSGITVNEFGKWVIITAIINLSFAFLKLLSETRKNAFSFSFMFYLFNFIFFGLTPIVQSLTNWNAWGLSLSDNEKLFTNIIIFIWMLTFELGRKIKYKFTLRKKNKKENVHLVSDQQFYLGITIDAAVLIVLLITVGFGRLFFKGEAANITINNSSLSLIQFHVLRNTVFFIAVIFFNWTQETGKHRLITFLAFLFFLLGVFPTGLSRYMAGSLWGGYLIHLIRKKHIGKWVSVVLIFGILILFPISGIFRNAIRFLSFSELLQYIPRSFNDTYTSGNYDAHQMLGAAVQYVRLFGDNSGHQLIGAILFFIPRSLWPNKPIGTGAMVISQLTNASFTNVSMPLVGEAYVNFGIIGVVVFAVILGYTTEHLDKAYWNQTDSLSSIRLIYPSAMLYFFFMNRGDLLSSGSYLFAHVFMGLLLCRILVKREAYFVYRNSLGSLHTMESL